MKTHVEAERGRQHVAARGASSGRAAARTSRAPLASNRPLAMAQLQAMADDFAARPQTGRATVREVVQRAAAGGIGGAITGAAIGFAAGGPVGLLAGAIGGALLGHIGEEVVTRRSRKRRIANRMHFVWLGGRIPDVRRDNILLWRHALPGDAVVRVWVDDHSQAASADIIGVLTAAHVQIVNIGLLAQRDARVRTATERLPTTHDDGRVNPPATGALSDIVRLAALQAEGGTYMDSDNRPIGAESADLVGGDAPAGVRLGSIGGVMSNDAISAAPDNPFIEQYLAAASANLTPARASVILHGGIAARDEVMRTTGPEALASIPLPEGEELLAIAAAYPGAFGAGAIPAQLTTAVFRNLYGYRELMDDDSRAQVEAYAARIGMGGFQREQGNAWL